MQAHEAQLGRCPWIDPACAMKSKLLNLKFPTVRPWIESSLTAVTELNPVLGRQWAQPDDRLMWDAIEIERNERGLGKRPYVESAETMNSSLVRS